MSRNTSLLMAAPYTHITHQVAEAACTPCAAETSLTRSLKRASEVRGGVHRATRECLAVQQCALCAAKTAPGA
eukprot:10740-Heterococcus_DN1.PRE.4